eukprot:1801057-Rhodomonas_salina.1
MFTSSVHIWVRAGANAPRTFWIQDVDDAWDSVEKRLWISYRRTSTADICYGTIRILRQLAHIANACISWYEFKSQESWRRMVHQAREIAAGRMLPSLQWAQLFADGGFFQAGELIMIFRAERPDGSTI